MDAKHTLESNLNALNAFRSSVPETVSEAMFLESQLRNLACLLRAARKANDDLTEQLMEDK